MDRSTTYDFLLVIYSNHWSILYRFRHKRRFLSKIAFFPPVVYLLFNDPAKRVPIGILFGGAQKNSNDGPARMSKSSWYLHSFRRSAGIRWTDTDWRTDGRTELVKQYRALHA